DVRDRLHELWGQLVQGLPDQYFELVTREHAHASKCRGDPSQVGSSRPVFRQQESEPMATQVKMPQLGETVVEGTITRWLKREGEAVGMDEPLVEVSTDKVDSEIPSPVSGTVSRIHAGEGETVTVGSVIAEIAGAGEEAPPAAAPPAPETPEKEKIPVPAPEAGAAPAAARAPAPTPAPAAAERPAAASPRPQPAPPAARPAAASQSVAPAARVTEAAPAADEPLRGVLSPLVRKLANERGIDLATVRGTGTGGRIPKQDVLAAPLPADEPAPQPAAEPAPEPIPAPAAPRAPAPAAVAQPAPAAYAAPSSGGDEVVPISNMRKSIAEHMVSSNIETARAWNAVEVDMTRIYHLRR